MDRNTNPGSTTLTFPVALRKESVDRNRRRGVCRSHARQVALRKESVDRNIFLRRCTKWMLVALRKESVDRNPTSDNVPPDNAASLSARRAWIEIAIPQQVPPLAARRSPQGERG